MATSHGRFQGHVASGANIRSIYWHGNQSFSSTPLLSRVFIFSSIRRCQVRGSSCNPVASLSGAGSSCACSRNFPSRREKPVSSREKWNGLETMYCENGKNLSKVVASAAFTSTEVGADEDGASTSLPPPEAWEEPDSRSMLAGWRPPRYVWRAIASVIIAGQVVIRVLRGRVHVRNLMQQLDSVGLGSLGVSLLTASFVGMVFTIQFVREFARLGLTRSVGGVLALALARELSPVVTAIILAGRVGSAFAAELGTMQVSEQTDTLRVLRTDPVDYLVTPRVIACCIALPILTIICFTVGMAASVLLADSVYNVSSNIILESAARALQPWDLISTMIKATVFGGIISIISCAWGVTTNGGAKGVGESTTSAVVISLVCIFIADFIMSWLFFQGAGDALRLPWDNRVKVDLYKVPTAVKFPQLFLWSCAVVQEEYSECFQSEKQRIY